MILASDGYLYGTTVGGGAADLGATYRMGTGGSAAAVTHSFTGTTTDKPDGARPYARLFEVSKGVLVGTTAFGGRAENGTVFKETFSGGSYAILHFFGGKPDGANPTAELILGPTAAGAVGFLYGTTFNGGDNGQGTVYRLTPTGSSYTVAYSFAGGPDDGANPWAGLARGPDGKLLFGTTVNGGVMGVGTIYAVDSTSGIPLTEVVGHSFGFGEGERPFGALILSATDGQLYGTTRDGGKNLDGTIFNQSP